MPFKHAYLLSCICIPEADGGVSGARGEQAAIRGPRHATDEIGMPRKSVEWLPGVCIPEANGAVIGGRGEQAPIGDHATWLIFSSCPRSVHSSLKPDGGGCCS